MESIALIVAHSKAFLEQHPQGLILLGAYNIGRSPSLSSPPSSLIPPTSLPLLSYLISSPLHHSAPSVGKERVICELQDTLGLTVYMEEGKLQVMYMCGALTDRSPLYLPPNTHQHCQLFYRSDIT